MISSRRLRLFALLLFICAVRTSALAAAPSAAPGQSVTLLPDGRWLLLGGDGPVATVSIVGEAGNTITATTTISARRHHTATVLPDGRVLVLGGVDGMGAMVPGAEILDPRTLKLVPASTAGLSLRAGHTATVLMDGRVLIAGGVSPAGTPITEIEIWDPKTGLREVVSEPLKYARSEHRAQVLPSGAILLSGGRDAHGIPIDTPEMFLPEVKQFSSPDEAAAAETAAAPNSSRPGVAAILPQHGADGVALDAMIAARFSSLMRVPSLDVQTVTLLGPGGETGVRVVPAEGGRLLFVTPEAELFPGADYTLFINGALDENGMTLPFTAVNFRTRSLPADHDRANSQVGSSPDDPEVFQPGPAQLRGDWRVHAPDSPLQQLPPLAAPPGVTAFAGQVLLLNGEPAVNVALGIGDRSVRTDETGRFLLEDVAPGIRTLVIDGTTASRPGHTYGFFEALVSVAAGRTTALRYTIWLPKINAQHAVSIPSPTTHEVVVTSPHIPGLELHIPPGVVLRDRAGRIVHEVSITPIPVDRPPFPLPSRDVPVYFTIQPGGVRLQSVNATSAPGARLVYPNYTGSAPGTLFDFWNYDPAVKSWYVYGQGHVSADAQHVVPDYGVAIYEFTGAMVSFPTNAPPEGPPPGGCKGQGGDPVDCYTGLFVLPRTDLALPGTIPISVSRTYRPRDTVSRAFGLGNALAYDIFTIGDTWPYTYQELILADGGRVRFNRTSPGTSFGDAVYEHTSSPTEYQGAVISYVAGQWRLRRKDGVEMYFADCEGCTSARAAGMIAYKDRWGNQLGLQRDSNKNLTRITSPDGKTIDLTYDASNRVSQARDISGRTVTYQYDASGRLWKVTNPEGGVEEYGYDTSNRMTTVKKPNGTLLITNVYDTNGRVTRQTLADGGVYQFAYTLDGTGKVTRSDITDPLNNVRRVTFSANGFVTGETLGLGTAVQQATTFELGAGTNLIAASVDALGRRTTFAYDPRGNMTSRTRLAGTPDAVTDSTAYDPISNEIISTTDPLGHVTQFRYDTEGLLSEVEDPLGNISRFTYAARQQVATAADPAGNVARFDYDGGDLSSVTDPLGNVTRLFTDTVGRVLSVTDPLGNRTRYAYDRLDHMTGITDPNGGATSFLYDANGNLTQINDAKGGLTKFSYDAKDRMATMVDPLNKTESYLYDAMDNLTQLTERNGKVTTYTYDALDRRTSSAHGRTKQGSSLTAPDATVTYTRDTGNRLTQVVDTQDGTTTRVYDGLDRVSSESSPRGSISYGYDAAGRRTRLSVPGQNDITYTYDDANRLSGIIQGAAQVGFDYDAAGRQSMLILPNGVIAAYSYDAAGHLTGITYTRGPTQLGDLIYRYDATGRRVSLEGSLAKVTLPNAVSSAAYDAGNRLSAWAGTTRTYDSNGNLTNDGTRTYTWDSRNRLKTIAGAATGNFAYDSFGRRSSATLSGATTSFLYDGRNIGQELTGGSVKATILAGLGLDETFRRSDAAGTRTLLTDGLGSTLALTDDSGVVRTSYAYDPFGATTAAGDASGNSFQYTGRENDGAGLYYYRTRYYEPKTGRFLNEDPIRWSGGQNFFTYVGDDPINFTDAIGLYGTNDCSYYERRCEQSGGGYYCSTAQWWCKHFGDKPDPDPNRDDDFEGWRRCVRQCLQDCDARQYKSSCPDPSYGKNNPDPSTDSFFDLKPTACHVYCYSKCAAENVGQFFK